jgi:hypothetical protein
MIEKSTRNDKPDMPKREEESRREKASDVMTANPQTVNEKQTIR